MAAYSAALNGHEVLLLEKNEKLGKKIYITGKGRCNLANYCSEDDFLKNVVSNPKFLYSSIHRLSPYETVDLFNNLGLSTKVERGNRVFPESDHASDVTKVLEKALKNVGVRIELNTTVLKIKQKDGRFTSVKTQKGEIEGDACIVATGGLSYPSTGSTGDGYEFALDLGHTVIPTIPSLVGLKTKETFVREMEGLSLKNIRLKCLADGKEKFKEMGELLFTHNGVSGPLILTISSYFAKEIASGREIKLVIDLKPALSEEVLDNRIVRDFISNSNKAVKNILGGLLPSSMVPVMLQVCGIDPEKKANSITAQERKSLVKNIKEFKLDITRAGDYSEAVVTKGGVSTGEINPRTLESIKCRGVYFAGEVMDVDALTGGYNLQIAWSTGYAAGLLNHEEGKVKKKKMKAVSIAIDGPAGAGKSTIAKRVAKELGYIYIDTGAMYRALGYSLIKNGVSLEDEAKVVENCRNTTLTIEYKDQLQHVIVNGEDVTGLIRTDEVGSAASKISAYKEVRAILVSLQQKMAEKESVVMDGRDIGSVVLPNATVKIYLTASVKERAKRRYAEYVEKGQECSLEQIKKDIEERDHRDMTRENSPLVCVPDAHVIDSSFLNIDQVCQEVFKLVEKIKS